MSTPADPIPPAQARENAEPTERRLPMPLLAAAITLVMVLIGAGYVLLSDPFGMATLGDRRTVADLSAPSANSAAATTATSANGPALYATHCVACHQATGQGLSGVFPPLDGSEWVQGDTRTLVSILLHGINGEIEVKGMTYKSVMPSFKQLADAQIAALASHIRSQWSNSAGPITTEQVAALRKSDTRAAPFEGGAALKALSAAR